MTTDTQLRERLESRANEHNISVSSLQDITAAGDRSVRRTRVTGGFCMIALVMVGLFGFAGLRSQDEPTSMFAGLDGEFAGSPAAVITTEDGWLGAVLVFDEAPWALDEAELPPFDEWAGEIYLTTSPDGESWELAEPTGLISTSAELAIDEHEGRYWLALTEGEEAYLAFSDDLRSWTRQDIPLEFSREAESGMKRVVTTRSLVANSAGVMAQVSSRLQPDFEALLDIDHRQACGIRWTTAFFGSPASIGVRPCGQSTWERHELGDVDLSMTIPETILVFSPDGEGFIRVEGTDSGRVVAPYSDIQNLYSTGTGFGISDYVLIESTNGIDWTTFNVNRLTSPTLAAARGDVRLTSSMHHTRTVSVRMSLDGQVWTTHSLDDALGIDPDDLQIQFSLGAIEVGEAGWAISGFLSHPETFENEFSEITTDLVIQLEDYELRGTLPAGPADLVADDGEVLASWDNFELSQVSQNEHVEIKNNELTIRGGQGQQLVQVPTDTFLDQLWASSQRAHVVLFSPDGETWTELHRGQGYPLSVAVGDGEVVVIEASAQGPDSILLPIETD